MTALARFVEAQAPVYERALAELRQGRKQSHWMWFVFPQIAGLGSSRMSAIYAIASAAEARAYLAHPLLGPRLVECTTAVLGHRGTSAEEIFGDVDALKFRSSMTLFAAVAEPDSCFAAALAAFYGGSGDALTLQRLQRGTAAGEGGPAGT
jgi:uncharacterized protein (DUF1810 family)